ncbi:hypothetical protein H261_00565 [Paramagnetospirillum caucaseum]|uniref:Uncharacterized protein n=1 Tax=Paramagnetospirillum caucaseum TaxID=1244869 RepID=M2YFU9_9PROT|nr:hypothetical protein H261_00565 [Paramagnetospirillum caucaseum]
MGQGHRLGDLTGRWWWCRGGFDRWPRLSLGGRGFFGRNCLLRLWWNRLARLLDRRLLGFPFALGIDHLDPCRHGFGTTDLTAIQIELTGSVSCLNCFGLASGCPNHLPEYIVSPGGSWDLAGEPLQFRDTGGGTVLLGQETGEGDGDILGVLAVPLELAQSGGSFGSFANALIGAGQHQMGSDQIGIAF